MEALAAPPQTETNASIGLVATEKKEGIYLRVSPKEKRALEKLAKADRRKLSDWIRNLAFDRLEQAKKDAASGKEESESEQ